MCCSLIKDWSVKAQISSLLGFKTLWAHNSHKASKKHFSLPFKYHHPLNSLCPVYNAGFFVIYFQSPAQLMIKSNPDDVIQTH